MIAGIDELQVIARAEPRDAGQLKVGQPLTVKFPFSNRTLMPEVEAIHSDTEPGTGKVSIRATIPNPDHVMKAGIFVRLEVDIVPSPASSTVRAITAEHKSNLGVEDAVERGRARLARLLEEKNVSIANEEIRRRLIELERKLDRVLDRARKNEPEYDPGRAGARARSRGPRLVPFSLRRKLDGRGSDSNAVPRETRREPILKIENAQSIAELERLAKQFSPLFLLVVDENGFELFGMIVAEPFDIRSKLVGVDARLGPFDQSREFLLQILHDRHEFLH